MGLKEKNFRYIFRDSFGAAKFLTRMLSLILRRDFFFSLGKKNFFLKALQTICWCQKRFLKIFAVLGTLKLSEIFNSLRACSDLYAHAEHTGQELKRTLSVRVRN